MTAMMLELEQALGLSAMHSTQCKIIGDNRDDDNCDDDDNDDDNDSDNDDDNVNGTGVRIGTGVRAFGNIPNSMQNNW